MKTYNWDKNIISISDKKFKTSTICMMLRRPLVRQEATLNALLANVLGSGSEKYCDMYEISKYLENLYGAVFDAQVVKKGEFQVLRFFIEVVSGLDKDLFSKAVEFLYEILYKPLAENGGFSKEIFDTEKEMLEDSIKERINDKGNYARMKCTEKMFENEPFGIYADGYLEDLENLNEKILFGHYEKILAETPLEFVITGNIDEDEAEETIEKVFSFKLKLKPEKASANIIFMPKDESLYSESMDISQGKICIGLRADSQYFGSGYFSFLVLNEILGGSGNSKLFMNVREKESLCYNIFSFVNRAKGVMIIQSGVELGNLDLALEKIKEQINAVKQGEISQTELETAKISLVNHFKGMKDYQGTMLDFYYTCHIYGDESNTEDIIEHTQNVTLEDVKSMGKTLYIDTIYMLKGAQ